MCDVDIYEDTINPFDIETAKRFVYAHRNVFAKRTTRRVLDCDFSLIVVKEISTDPEGLKHVWYWGFSPTKRAIVRNCDSDDEAIEKLREVLSS